MAWIIHFIIGSQCVVHGGLTAAKWPPGDQSGHSSVALSHRPRGWHTPKVAFLNFVNDWL